jgi:hypothetical protein
MPDLYTGSMTAAQRDSIAWPVGRMRFFGSLDIIIGSLSLGVKREILREQKLEQVMGRMLRVVIRMQVWMKRVEQSARESQPLLRSR